MHWRREFAVVAAVPIVCGVQCVSAFAQADDRVSRSFAAPVPALQHSHPLVTRVYLREQSFTASAVSIPDNLSFPSSFRSLIESMFERSATFRRQCLRIAQAHWLTVRIVSYRDLASSRSRARTTIRRAAGGRLEASVSVQPSGDVAELIAHELEHVIEQLDGVDLRARSALDGTGVWHSEDGSYETTRAVRMGRAVARETGSQR
jgi:hypothetical protein